MTVITVAVACDVWHCTFPRCSGDAVMTQRIFMLPVDASPVCSDWHVRGNGKSRSETNSSSVHTKGVYVTFSLLSQLTWDNCYSACWWQLILEAIRHWRANVLTSESQDKGDKATSITSPVVDKERMGCLVILMGGVSVWVLFSALTPLVGWHIVRRRAHNRSQLTDELHDAVRHSHDIVNKGGCSLW